MQDLITTYLFKNNKCPLPTVGALHIIEGNATSLFGEIKIAAPVPDIQFGEKEIPPADFIKYIASQKNISVDEAAMRLHEYCETLKQIEDGIQLLLGEIGKFYMTSDGNLQFKKAQIPAAFMPAVTAERIIHPNDSHAMLVGDTQTTNTVMSDFFNEEELQPKNPWWIWAIILFVLAAIVILIYYNDKNSNATYGNAQSYTLSS